MNIGETLWQSARNLQDSSVNLDLLWEALDLPTRDTDGRIFEYVSYDSAGEWIYYVSNRYFSVRENSKKKKPNGSITLAIQLTSNEAERSWTFGKVAKVFAGYYPGGEEDWEFDLSNPDASGECEESGNWIFEEFRWYDPGSDGWFFAVPLAAIDSTEAVQKHVIQPLLSMIGGASPATAFLGIEDRVCRPPQRGPD